MHSTLEAIGENIAADALAEQTFAVAALHAYAKGLVHDLGTYGMSEGIGRVVYMVALEAGVAELTRKAMSAAIIGMEAFTTPTPE